MGRCFAVLGFDDARRNGTMGWQGFHVGQAETKIEGLAACPFQENPGVKSTVARRSSNVKKNGARGNGCC